MARGAPGDPNPSRPTATLLSELNKTEAAVGEIGRRGPVASGDKAQDQTSHDARTAVSALAKLRRKLEKGAT